MFDFVLEVKKAKQMTNDQLRHALADARECVELDINPSKYIDQISVYSSELNRRGVI